MLTEGGVWGPPAPSSAPGQSLADPGRVGVELGLLVLSVPCGEASTVVVVPSSPDQSSFGADAAEQSLAGPWRARAAMRETSGPCSEGIRQCELRRCYYPWST